MSKHQDREDWLRDVEASQRNTVFPDTADNERRFWKNVLSGKRPLSLVQAVGLFLIGLMLICLLFSTIADPFREGRGKLPLWAFVINNYGGYIIALGVLGGFLLLLKFAT